jgi:hypothetical protein
MVKDPKEEFKALYESYDRDRLVQVGKDHLAGNLKLRVRRHSRWFWFGFGVCVLVAVWLTVLAIVYVLERATVSANGFERQRRERLDRFGSD